MNEPHNDPSDPRHNPHAPEAERRWGHTDAHKESQRRVAALSKEDMRKIQQSGDALMREIAAASDGDPANAQTQALIARHYDGLRAFYEPSLELYLGLASMYVDDPRFAQFFDRYKPGLAAFMRDAMRAYCDAQSSTFR